MKSNVLVHSSYGRPDKVIELSTYELDNPKEHQVLVRVVASPINPADLNMIEGTYLLKPDLPCVLGSEGVGVVESVGDNVKTLKKGDYVIRPFAHSQWIGWWTEYILSPESELMKIDSPQSEEQASMYTVNPVTAYQLLTRYVDLKPGDTVVQNAGNSGVGLWVNAIGKKLGVNVVNTVRGDDQVNFLKSLGFEAIRDEAGCHVRLPENTQLALNGIGGQSSKEIMKTLEDDAVLVTYGAMSKEPIPMSNSALIYNNLWLTGFNRNKWLKEAPREEIEDVYSTVLDLVKELQLSIPVASTYSLDQASEALAHAEQSGRGGKVIFRF